VTTLRKDCRSRRSRSPSSSRAPATPREWSANGTSDSCRSFCRCVRAFGRVVRPAVLARHADDGPGRQGLQDGGVLRPEARVLGRAADAKRSGHRAAGRPSHVDEALQPRKRSRSSMRTRAGRSSCISHTRCRTSLWRARTTTSTTAAAACTATSSKRSTGARARCWTRCARPASTDRRSSSSPATTVRGFRSRRTAAPPVRFVTARARPGKAACARRRFSGGLEP